MMSCRLSTIAKTVFVFGFLAVEKIEIILLMKPQECWRQKEKVTMKSTTM